MLTPLYDEREAQAIARMVAEDAFGLTTTDIYMGKVSELSTDDGTKLVEIMRRLCNGEPIQYVLGHAGFYGRSFGVGQGVLIPRPETERLIPLLADAADGEFSLLDIGTGSGCIAITAALEYPKARVSAWDISPTALSIAQANARKMGASVAFALQDALKAPHDVEKWDVVVSNPPYICEQERASMAPNVVDHEPEIALFVPDDDPLRFYRPITRYASAALKPGGRLLFEINPLYADPLLRLILDTGFAHAEAIDDQFGKQRFIKATKP